MAKFFEMTEEERKAYVENLRKEEEQKRNKAREEYKERADNYARLYTYKAELMEKVITMLEKHNGKQWTKRIADDIQSQMPQVRAYKLDEWSNHYIVLSFPAKFPMFGYNDTDLRAECYLGADGRVDYAKTADALRNRLESLRNNATEYKRTRKELEKAIKAARKLEEQIKNYAETFDFFTRKFTECRISNAYLLH